MGIYFMSPPSKTWALRGRANFRSRESDQVNALAARKEWLALAEAIESLGGKVIAVESSDPLLTGMPYAAEAGHVVAKIAKVVRSDEKPLFLLPSMASQHRQREKFQWKTLVTSLGFDVVDIHQGTWEAQGDVAVFQDVNILFWGGRTSFEGMQEAAPWIGGEQLHIQIREPAFHGNMALLPLEAVGKILVCPDVMVGDSLAKLEHRFGADTLLHVTEDEIRHYATNGLPIGKTILCPSVVPLRVQDLLTQVGMTVQLITMKELCEKAGGASRCLVCYGNIDINVVPENNSLATFAKQIRAEV